MALGEEGGRRLTESRESREEAGVGSGRRAGEGHCGKSPGRSRLLPPRGWVLPGSRRLEGRGGLLEEGHLQPLGSLAGASSLEKERNKADGAILPGWAPPPPAPPLPGVGVRPSAPWRAEARNCGLCGRAACGRSPQELELPPGTLALLVSAPNLHSGITKEMITRGKIKGSLAASLSSESLF